MTAALWTGARAWMLGRGVVSARDVADGRRGPTTCADSARRSVSRKVALGAHAVAAGPRGRLSRHGGPRRCGLRRQRDAASDLASSAAAVRARDLVDADRVSWNAAGRHARRANGPRGHASDPPASHRRHVRPEAVRAIAAQLPARAWRRVSWRNGTNRPWAAHFAALRVTPAHDWRARRLAPEVWLLFERDLGDHAPHQGLSSSRCRPPRRCAPWSGWRINAGRSNSSIRN